SGRPRDGLGRPLPYGAPGVERQPEGVVRAPGETLREAQRLLDDGRPFHAHEVFEDAWKSTGEPGERGLWKGLAQLAVGVTHAARGNPRGARALLLRAAEAIQPYADRAPYGIDARALSAWARRTAEGVDGGGADGEGSAGEGVDGGGSEGGGGGFGGGGVMLRPPRLRAPAG
ncbi:DUF309 domain-containing protein, partial [Streptomyces pathocidini]|uniref:DUF309 domain-containing protein n=1 Tax=Streptomyces pathocidini TaxID=1650571 RepID=UPI0033E690B5